MENNKYILDKLDYAKIIFEDGKHCTINNIKDYDLDLYSDRPSCIHIISNILDSSIKEYFDNRKYVKKVILAFVGVTQNNLCNPLNLVYTYNVNALIQNIQITDLEFSLSIEGDFHVE